MNTTNAPFYYDTHFKIHYETKKPVPIEDIITSLRSIENLLKRSPAFIEAAYKGVNVKGVEVYLESLKAGSLTEDLLVRILFGDKENYDKFLDQVGKKPVLRLVLGAAVIVYVTYATTSLFQGKPTPNVNSFNDNIIVNVGADAGITSGEIEAILEASKDKKKLAKDVAGFAAPAKNDPDLSIELPDVPQISLSKEVVREIPTIYEAPEPEEKSEPYDGVKLLIKASDSDSHSRGWAGLIPGIVDSRTSIELLEGVLPSEMHGKLAVEANVLVVERYRKSSRDYVPIKIEVSKVL